jgi:hypothetical protein
MVVNVRLQSEFRIFFFSMKNRNRPSLCAGVDQQAAVSQVESQQAITTEIVAAEQSQRQLRCWRKAVRRLPTIQGSGGSSHNGQCGAQGGRLFKT